MAFRHRTWIPRSEIQTPVRWVPGTILFYWYWYLSYTRSIEIVRMHKNSQWWMTPHRTLYPLPPLPLLKQTMKKDNIKRKTRPKIVSTWLFELKVKGDWGQFCRAQSSITTITTWQNVNMCPPPPQTHTHTVFTSVVGAHQSVDGQDIWKLC